MLVLFVLPRPAEACTCAQLTLCATLPAVEAIFVARAEVLASGSGTQRTRLHIADVFKGTLPRTLEVLSTGLGGSCDYAFMPDASHLVYAYRDKKDGTWKVSLCSRTTTVDQAREDLAALNALRAKPLRAGTLPGLIDPTLVTRYCEKARKPE